MNLCHRLWQGRRRMKADPVELLTCCVWLTWSNLSNLCLCPQAWIAFQFPFSPRLTVICCWLNSSACLAGEYSLQREGENQYQAWEPPFLLHMLCTGTKRWIHLGSTARYARGVQLLPSLYGNVLQWCSRYISSISKQNLGSSFKNTFKKSVHVLLPFVAHDKTVGSKSTAVLEQTIPASKTHKLTGFRQLLNR